MTNTAIYTGGFFIVYDEEKGPTLYKEGFYGKPLGIDKPKTPIFKAKMILSFFEALYLKRNNLIKIIDEEGSEIDDEKLIKEAYEYIDDFEIKYIVYEDLRKKGYIPRLGTKFGATFLVYRYGPGIDHAPFLVDVMRKEDKLKVIEIIRAGRLSHSVRKRLILAMVNPENREISYYIFRWFE